MPDMMTQYLDSPHFLSQTRTAKDRTNTPSYNIEGRTPQNFT